MAQQQQPYERVVTKTKAVVNPALHDGRAFICGGVIDNDQLEALLGLNSDALERLGDAVGSCRDTLPKPGAAAGRDPATHALSAVAA